MAQTDHNALDLVTPDMIIARQRLQELREEADDYRRAGGRISGRLSERIRAALGMAG